MSLLEDVFLQDEANEAEELERVIEGDEFEERRRSDSDENSEKEDEAEEDKRKVDPTKAKTTRIIKNPRFLLNPARLTGPRGIQVIPEHFKDFKFKGKGHEKEDLDLVLKKLEHWAYRLYPKFQFEDCLKKIEMLGKKRPVAVHLHKIRSDQFLSEDTVVQKDSSDEDTPMPVQEEDEFDKLLQQQIELARSTPAPNSEKKPDYDGSISPKDKRTTSLMMPKATSSPSINEEQRERMFKSRRLAEERRLARLKNVVNTDGTEDNGSSRLITTKIYPTNNNVENRETNVEASEGVNKDTNEIGLRKKQNRSNIIDSSDEETVEETCVSIAVDVHTVNKITDENDIVEKDKFTQNIINGDSYSDADEARRIADEIEVSTNTLCNSNLGINEGKTSLEATKDKTVEEIDSVENNISNVNDQINEKSDENIQLRYDDSDMSVDLNEHNVSDKHDKTIINSKKDAEIEKTKTIEHTAKQLDKKELNSMEETDRTSQVEIDKSRSKPTKITQDVINEENDRTEVEPEETFEDVMDVDFNEDF